MRTRRDNPFGLYWITKVRDLVVIMVSDFQNFNRPTTVNERILRYFGARTHASIRKEF